MHTGLGTVENGREGNKDHAIMADISTEQGCFTDNY